MFIATQSLANSHKELRRLFLLVQESLLIAEDQQAVYLLQAFSAYLAAHLQFEEQYLFPLLEIAPERARWQAIVYQKEHEKILQLLQSAEARMQAYIGFSGREKRLALLELLEQLSRFSHVLEHHEQREETDLFLLIDQQLQEKELQALEQQWQLIEQEVLAPYKEELAVINHKLELVN